MPPRLAALAIVVAAWSLLAACGDDGGGSKAPTLEGAVHPEALPVYSPSELRDIMGGTYSGGEGEPLKSLSWFFETADPMDKVEAWYDRKLPHALKESGEDEGDVVYSWVGAGLEGAKGERFQVTLRPARKEFQLTEKVVASKR
ncbi:MAG: hypothetical protein DMD79_26855, partial [Candidatus Rokuibacteriota bacterium]